MRRITLFITLLALSGIIVAQQAAMERKSFADNPAKKTTQTALKDGGDVIWSEDFATFGDGFPEGWLNVDLSDNNMPWLYWTDSVYGAFTQGFIESPTADNGFMLMNADGYNTVPPFDPDGVESPNLVDVDAYFQTRPLDLTTMTSGAILEFHHQYRYFTGMWYGVMVSSDYDPDNPTSAHWSEYQTNTAVGVGDPAQDETYQINISSVATGQSNVVIRWYAHSSDAYFWCVDDIKIIEPFLDNMILADSWAFYAWENEAPTGSAHTSGDLQHGGFYTQIPKGQEEAFVGFKGAIQNFGINDQTNVIMTTDITMAETDSTEYSLVYTVATEPKSVDASVLDSLVTDADYTPSEYGYYNIDMTVSMDANDELTSDNVDHWEFIVNDSTYTRVTDDINSSLATRNWVGGGVDGDGLGVHFTLLENVEVEAMRWYFAAGNDDWMDLILSGGYSYVCKIFSYNFEDDDWQTSPLVASEAFTIDTSQLGSWITTPFMKDGSAEYLVPGDYMMYIETYTSVGTGENDDVGFYFGEDLSVPQPDVILHLWLESSWGWSYGNPSFELKIAADNWSGNDKIPISAEETSRIESDFTLSQNYPNPAIDNTEINYTITRNSTIVFEVFDVTGKSVYKLNEGLKTAGRHQIDLNVSDFQAGIYYYTIKAGTNNMTRKMVVMH